MRNRVLSLSLGILVLASFQLACSELTKQSESDDVGAQATSNQDIKQTVETEKKQIKMSLLQQLTNGRWRNCSEVASAAYVLTEIGYQIDGKRPIRQKIYKDSECSIEFSKEEVEALSPTAEMRELYEQGVAKVESYKLGKLSGNVVEIDLKSELGTKYTKLKLELDRIIVAVCENQSSTCASSAAERANSFIDGIEYKFVKK